MCQSANIMTMAGVPTTENDIISIALHSSDGVLNSMELFEEDPDERGGTTVNNRKEILESQGIPITNLPINIDRARTVRQLAVAVASGHGVILSVDVERLWRNGQSGGHAISLLSVSRDGSTFIYSDTGAGEINTISAADLAAALTGRPANVTTNIILLKISCWIFAALMGVFSFASRSWIMGIMTAIFSAISYGAIWLWVKICKIFLMWSMR